MYSLCMKCCAGQMTRQWSGQPGQMHGRGLQCTEVALRLAGFPGMVAHRSAAVQLPAMRSRTSRDITAALWLRPSLGHWLRSHLSSS